MKKFARGFRYAAIGIKYATRGRNFRAGIVCTLVTLAASAYFGITSGELSVVILTIGLVLSMEAANTATEEICNKFHPEEHPHIALIKDLAAGAAFLAVITAFIIGLIIFLPYIF